MEVFKINLLKNIRPGLTVALISLPLSIALSIASGAGPIPGIITGIWAPIIASLFGSSNYNIIGTAGALTTILFGATLVAGPAVLPFLAIVSGFIIMGIFLLRLDKYLRYIPSSVIYGFATGVAILIAANQLFDAVGLSFVDRSGNFLTDLALFVRSLPDLYLPSLFIAISTLAFLLVWKLFIKSVPGAIPVSILGSIVGLLSEKGQLWGIDYVTLEDKFGEISAHIVALPDLAVFENIISDHTKLVWFLNTAFVVAIISVLETLITARIGDKVTKTEHKPSIELRGLGLANIVSGFVGGLPATGVFIRAGLNIKSGANSKVSQGLSGVFLALLAILAWPLLQYLPMPVIAGLLMITAIGLIETEHFLRYWRLEKSSLLVGVVVALTTVIDDAGTGVMVGVVMALLIFIDSITKGRFDVTLNVNRQRFAFNKKGGFRIPKDVAVDVVVYSIAGFLAYADSAHHREHLKIMARTPSIETVIIRMRNLHYADLDGIDALAEGVESLIMNNKKVLVCSFNSEVLEQLKTSSIFTDLLSKKVFYSNTEKALKSIGYTVEHMHRDAPYYISGGDNLPVKTD